MRSEPRGCVVVLVVVLVVLVLPSSEKYQWRAIRGKSPANSPGRWSLSGAERGLWAGLMSLPLEVTVGQLSNVVSEASALPPSAPSANAMPCVQR